MSRDITNTHIYSVMQGFCRQSYSILIDFASLQVMKNSVYDLIN